MWKCHVMLSSTWTQQTEDDVNLEWFAPRRFRTRSLRVLNDRIQFLLEQDEDAVHDAHDEVRRLGKFPHRRNVGRFDRLRVNTTKHSCSRSLNVFYLWLKHFFTFFIFCPTFIKCFTLFLGRGARFLCSVQTFGTTVQQSIIIVITRSPGER